MSARRVRETLLDTLARHHVFAELSPHRLIPLLEGAQYHAFEPGTVVFEQFHPAGMFYLLCGGAVTQARFGSERTKPVQRTALD